jgi:hypothetical protein
MEALGLIQIWTIIMQLKYNKIKFSHSNSRKEIQ